MNLLELKTFVEKIKSLNDADLYSELSGAGIGSIDVASRTFKGLKCLARINKLLEKKKKLKIQDYANMQVEGTPFTVKQAVGWLRNASDAYYNNRDADITDEEYDWVYSSLRKVLPYHPIFTERLQSNKDKDKSLSFSLLNQPIYSPKFLKLVYDLKSYIFDLHASLIHLKDWMSCVGDNELFCCYPKYQGVATVLYYDDGVLSGAYTVCDGIAGRNILSYVYQIESIPKVLLTGESAEIRGVIVLRKSKLKQLQKRGLKADTSLSAIVGTLKLKTLSMVAERGLDFCACDYLPKNKDFILRENEKLKTLVSLGFLKIGESCLIDVKELDDFLSYYQCFRFMNKMIACDNIPLWQDVDVSGIVVVVNDNKIQKSLGFSKYATNFSVVYPFPSTFVVGRVVGIDWIVKRFGILKPIVKLEPVLMNGFKIKTVSVGDFKTLSKLNVGKGCEVVLAKHELSIKLVAVKKQSSSFFVDYPVECPSCNKKLFFDEAEVNLCCGNINCEAQLVDKIDYYLKCVSNITIRKGLLGRLIQQKVVEDIADLYSIKKVTLMAVDDFGEKSVTKFIKMMLVAKQIRLSVFLQSLSIPFVDMKWAIKFAELVDVDMLLSPSLLSYFFAVNYVFSLKSRCEIPEIVIRNFCVWFAIPENNCLIKRLLQSGVEIIDKKNKVQAEQFAYSIVGVTEIPKVELIYFLKLKGYNFVDEGKADFIICNVMSDLLDKNCITEVELLSKILSQKEQSLHNEVLSVSVDILASKGRALVR